MRPRAGRRCLRRTGDIRDGLEPQRPRCVREQEPAAFGLSRGTRTNLVAAAVVADTRTAAMRATELKKISQRLCQEKFAVPSSFRATKSCNFRAKQVEVS